MNIIRGGAAQQATVEASASAATSQNDLLLESFLELKVITLHLAEIAGVKFGQEDVELETS